MSYPVNILKKFEPFEFELGRTERVTDTHVYFWRGPFSQWAYSEFNCTPYYHSMREFTGYFDKYVNCEQWMMAAKAWLMKDSEYLKKIIEESNPKTIKDYGREIRNFNSELWDKVKYSVVLEGQLLKFSYSHNKFYHDLLKATNGRILVEASPYDKVWGVGLREEDDLILDESNWKGENLLGKAITEAYQIIFGPAKFSSKYVSEKRRIEEEILAPMDSFYRRG